ncbi:MAG: 5'/3'-nucleotidase SurE [Alphaproteobacteria bacterium]
MRVLITNDDGINAPGMAALEKIARAISDDVWLVAPESEQSGASHSLTLHIPIRMRQVGARKFAVQGTPTDCVMMGAKHIIARYGKEEGDARRPDLVLSGVNRGANYAEDITYSGTVAGAMEGCALGIPSIAFSQSFGFTSDEPRWSVGEYHGPSLLAQLLEAGWPRGVLLNVNFPDVHPLEVARVEITRQGHRDDHGTRIIEREDARGIPYYWLGFERTREEPAQGSDMRAIRDGHISVTPLHLDLTHEAALTSLRERTESAPGWLAPNVPKRS